MDSYLNNSNLKDFPLVTVAVITRNRADSLSRTLEAIGQLDYPNYEVLVVDNASTDHTKEVIKKTGFKYLFSKKNNGFAKTRQIAVDAANGDFICWCDDDCVPEVDWINSFIYCFNTDQEISILGGTVVNKNFPKSSIFKGRSILGENGGLIFIEEGDKATFYGNLNLALKIKDIKEIGGYDKLLKGGYEEIDLAFRIKKTGKKIGFCRSAIVNHYHQEISFKKGRFFYGGQFPRIYFYLKHRSYMNDYNVMKFLKTELFLFIRDLRVSFRGLASGIKRLDLQKVKIFQIELINCFISRIAIPFILLKTIKY